MQSMLQKPRYGNQMKPSKEHTLSIMDLYVSGIFRIKLNFNDTINDCNRMRFVYGKEPDSFRLRPCGLTVTTTSMATCDFSCLCLEEGGWCRMMVMLGMRPREGQADMTLCEVELA